MELGWWQTRSGGVIGDAPADIVDGLDWCPASPAEIPSNTLVEIKRCYVTDLGREPTEEELRDLLGFCRG